MSAESRSPSHSVCTHPRSHGIALIAGAASALLLMTAHPRMQAHDVATLVPALVEGRSHNGIVHGGIMVALVVLFAGFLGLAERVDERRVTTRLALCATALGSLAWAAAATINGFVIPTLARGATGTTAAELAWLEAPLRLCSEGGHAVASIGTMAVFAALVAWSAALWHANRALAVVGLVLGCAGCIGILSGHVHMQVHALIVIVLAFGGWSAWAGVWLMRGSGSGARTDAG
jgi:hypothetical protein